MCIISAELDFLMQWSTVQQNGDNVPANQSNDHNTNKQSLSQASQDIDLPNIEFDPDLEQIFKELMEQN